MLPKPRKYIVTVQIPPDSAQLCRKMVLFYEQQSFCTIFNQNNLNVRHSNTRQFYTHVCTAKLHNLSFIEYKLYYSALQPISSRDTYKQYKLFWTGKKIMQMQIDSF